MKRLVVTLLILAFTASFTYAAELDGNAILKKADDQANSFDDLHFKGKLITVDKDGNKKARDLIIWQKSGMRLIKFTSPASDRGIGFLAIDSNNTFVFLPAYKKIRRIASHVRNQTFMGTDFAYEDMATPRYGLEYDAEVIEEKGDLYVLKLTRKASSKAAYPRLNIHIHKTNNTMHQLDYYNDKGELFKSEVRENFKQYGPTFWNADRSIMTDLKSQHKTIMEMYESKFNSGISDGVFTQRNLKRMVR